MDVLMGLRTSVIVATAVLVVAACKPDLEGRPSRIDGPRLLAVKATPAEVETRDAFSLQALVVDPNGTMNVELAYDLCVARKPLSELGSVSQACVSGAEGARTPLGSKPVMPDDACRSFGPEVPPPKAGEDPGRPADPDLSGGYYQPILAYGSGEDVRAELVQMRVACGVFGASSDQAADFRAHYHPNENPDIADVTVDGASASTTATVKAGATVSIRASWPTCPMTDACGDGVCGPDETRAGCVADCATPAKACRGAERYAYYDSLARAVVRKRESIVASFYATAGDYSRDRAGREGEDLATDASSSWTAPKQPGLVHGWVVIRDDRGGVGFRAFEVNVVP